ncbi:LacI family DNA-binding transcriptional regulator [Streptomyces fuscichromogenes]|uniref:LacI family transcriptional regulator n=1 Tax=Streptomyces fuscichromogenes TaxID=1324013 RepID=A0A917X9R0_9ACTN|nr:LacI family DNA-binding transcriptional regulator [Streptomyces fuscichromogenes]GGM98086.1 LacI family transcriptional regulator [Streptomyces fuscichromogenes]
MPTAGRPTDTAAGDRARSATSADVARHAGVSRATVSHVLNGQVERFLPETVDKVRQAAAELGYVRSAAGRALAMGRSDFVILVAPPTTLTNLQDIVDLVSGDLEKLGFTVVVHVSRAESAQVTSTRLHNLVEALRPAGLVDLGSLSEDELLKFQHTGCPVISPTIGTGGPRTARDDLNASIGRVQARHLHRRGYREIVYAFEAGHRDATWGRERMGGVMDVCERRGLTKPAYFDVPLEPGGARAALAAVLRGRVTPLGIACYSDEVAVALVFGAASTGVHVPRDVGIIGTYSGPVGQIVSPRLTSVYVDLRVSLSGIRTAIAETYGGILPPVLPAEARVISVVEGETA